MFVIIRILHVYDPQSNSQSGVTAVIFTEVLEEGELHRLGGVSLWDIKNWAGHIKKHSFIFESSSLHPFTRCPIISLTAAAAAAKSLQSCPTLCDPIDGSPPGSPVPGILQARTLEWGAISFSNAWKWKVKGKLLSCFRLLATPLLQLTRLLRPWDFPGKSTGVGCHCLLLYLSLTITNPLSFHVHTFGEQICTSHFPCCVGTWPSIYTLLPLCTYLLSTTIFFIIVQAYLFTSKMITKFPILICLSN